MLRGPQRTLARRIGDGDLRVEQPSEVDRAANQDQGHGRDERQFDQRLAAAPAGDAAAAAQAGDGADGGRLAGRAVVALGPFRSVSNRIAAIGPRAGADRTGPTFQRTSNRIMLHVAPICRVGAVPVATAADW